MAERPWLKFYDPEVPHTIHYPAKTVFQILRDTAKRYPTNSCTLYQNIALSYAQMETLSNALAWGLTKLGLRKGDRVALFMPNIPQFVLSFFAILKTGGVVVAINPTYKESETTFLLADSGAKMLIGIKSAASMIESIQPQTNLSHIIYTEPGDAFELADLTADMPNLSRPSPNPTDYILNLKDLMIPNLNRATPALEVSPEDAAIFQYSGGTTGTPKAAIGLHRNLVANIYQFRHWLHMLKDGEETFIDFIPLFHVYGMVIGMGVGIFLGARLVLIPNPRDIQTILRSIEEYHGTMVPGVPNIYHAIGNHPDVINGKYNLRSIKACISGSAPLLRETKEQFERVTGGKLVEGYGLSEAPTATHCNPIMGENRTGSIGLPLPDVDCRIVDMNDETTPLPPGQAGELIIRGPQIMSGYHRSEENAKALRNGWLYTGDIAIMDSDGYFYLVDRKKDVIKPGGLQVWPREVEEVIASHPAVKEVGVAGILHPEYGETVKAWVVLKPDHPATAEEIITWCKDRIADFKAPRQVEFIDQLPRSTVGKVLRRELVRQHYENLG